MAKRFLKLNLDSDEADFLALRHPNAFILLYFIARRARRTSGLADGLIIGQCHIGDYKSYGLTEREYRTAKEVLRKRSLVKILETCRTRKKSTTGTTTVGTLVQLLDSTVWDINSESNDDRQDDRATTERRPSDEEQERRRKKKKEEEKQPHTPSLPVSLKIKFRELVELTQEQHDGLLAKHGPEIFALMLDKLDSFKGSSGKKYASDFHTMKEGGWVINQVKKDLENQKTPNEKNFRNAPAGKPSGNIQSQQQPTKFYPSRVLRGGGEGSVDSGGHNE